VGSRGERVSLRRTEASTFHPETFESLRRAPITLGHPDSEGGNITPNNYGATVVGNVLGNVRRTPDNFLAGDILLADERAIKAHQQGVRQLSIRYSFGLEDDPSGEADFQTHGPLRINHVSLVPRGRSGPEVGIQDSADAGSELSQKLDRLIELLSREREDEEKGESDRAERTAASDSTDRDDAPSGAKNALWCDPNSDSGNAYLREALVSAYGYSPESVRSLDHEQLMGRLNEEQYWTRRKYEHDLSEAWKPKSQRKPFRRPRER